MRIFEITFREKLRGVNATIFDFMTESKYGHSGIQIARYQETILAVGGSTTDSSSVEVFDGESWSERSAYPYSNVLYKFATISKGDFVYFFGGYDGEDFQSQIAMFQNDSWIKVGTLKSPRNELKLFSNPL